MIESHITRMHGIVVPNKARILNAWKTLEEAYALRVISIQLTNQSFRRMQMRLIQNDIYSF